MNHLEHLAFCATRAETSGFPHFAAALRDLLAKELERCPRAEFFQFVLGLPHDDAKFLADRNADPFKFIKRFGPDGKLSSVSVDGEDLPANEYLKALENVCSCCGKKLGPSHACLPKRLDNGVLLVRQMLNSEP